MLPLVLADLEDRYDSRMVEVGRRLGLGVEPFDVGVVGKLSGQNHLERDNAVEAYLPGKEDDAHAATCQLADDLVIAEVADADGLGLTGRGGWISTLHQSGGLIVSSSGRVAGRHGWLFVDLAALVGAGLVAHRYSSSGPWSIGCCPFDPGPPVKRRRLTSRNISDSLASVPSHCGYFAAFGF
jgi:hypothetical protein